MALVCAHNVCWTCFGRAAVLCQDGDIKSFRIIVSTLNLSCGGTFRDHALTSAPDRLKQNVKRGEKKVPAKIVDVVHGLPQFLRSDSVSR